MSTITSSKTIEVLRTVFATYSLPRKVVNDNGPSFVSQEFKSSLQGNGIHHVTNSLAERGVQTLKRGLKLTTGSSVWERLSEFLFDY